MARKKEPDPLYEDWWELVSAEHRKSMTAEELALQEARWRQLWQQVLEPDPALKSVEIVGTLARTGWYYAFGREDFQEALDRLQVYFDHPGYFEDDYVGRVMTRGYQSHCLAALGRVHEALNVLKEDLRNPVRKHAYCAIHESRSVALWLLGREPPDVVASLELQDFVCELLRVKSPKGRFWKRVQAESTNRQLVKLLFDAWGAIDESDDFFSD